eukprot:TRINITY_DN2043_c1_g1_i2.p2 TRINITY_DN2043_c1_g1~~TRINITY_DN2043_c1_g1_i2.p2  ORF type:complete len:408 (+),score=153.44 TRINITY_DN2043_c1_g1_i2:59-1282(+)
MAMLRVCATLAALAAASAAGNVSNVTEQITVMRDDLEEEDDKEENVGLAVGLCVAAGLATSIGGAAPFFPKLHAMQQDNILAGSLALSSGVMIYVSFVEIFVKANDAITLGLGGDGVKLVEKDGEPGVFERETLGFVYPGNKHGNLYTTLTFFGGCVLVMLIHKLVHALSPSFDAIHPGAVAAPRGQEAENAYGNAAAARTGESPVNDNVPNDGAANDGDMQMVAMNVAATEQSPEGTQESEGAASVEDLKKNPQLEKMGLMTALALGLHNFPEGFATFIATLEEPSLGAALAVAIAIHNIPEGVSVAMPVYYATGSKWKGFGWAFLSGLSEPIGGILGWLALRKVFTDLVFGIVFGAVGGMMVWIVLSELLPTAFENDKTHGQLTGWCLFSGMVIISASLLAFAFA